MTGRLTIRNKSRYDTAEVRALVKFAVSEVDMRGVCVNVKNARNRAYRGRAYCGVPVISNANATADYLVTMSIGGPDRFPASLPRAGRLTGELADWREAFVFVSAHEAKHIEQFELERPRSEVECNVFAEYMLRRYRKETA